MPDIKIKYTAPPTVAKFLDSNAFVRLIVGPVGSGKSSGCIIELLRRASEQKPGPDGIRRTRFAVIRNTYRELQDTTRRTFEQWIPRELGKWSEQGFTFYMRFGDVDCEILFRALDRPEDINKLLSLEITGAYINEVREIPKEILDMLQTRVGRFPARFQGGASWYGIWADTNPWHDGHWGQEMFSKGPLVSQMIKGANGLPEEVRAELYRQPGGRAINAENIENLPNGYYERLCLGKDEEYIRVYVDGMDATGAHGAVFGDLIGRLGERGGICDFDHPKDGVYTSWDLGISDATAIWFWRLSNKAIDVIDYYEATGQPLSHFFDIIDTRGYKYVKHVLPHDARARTLQTGVSTVELVEKRFPGMTVIAPGLSVADGITAARWLLEQPMRFHQTKCDEGIKILRQYKYSWDEMTKVFTKTPTHNFASHAGDSFRYIACIYQTVAGSVVRTEEAPKKPVLSIRDWTLNDLMACEGDKPKGRGRIR